LERAWDPTVSATVSLDQKDVMFRNLKKKRVIVVLSALAALGIAGAAYAYFTGGSNSVTSSGTVGSPSQLAIAQGTASWSGTLSALYPGATNDTEYLPFTVTNNGKGHQAVSSVVATLPAETNGDAETAAGADIPGCLASWFTVTTDPLNPALPDDLAPAGTYTGKIDLTMTDTSTNQNACQGAAPAVTITAS
jgi:hypothetical protein